MEKNEEKNIDLELLVFYFGISLISFIVYIIKHPILSIFSSDPHYNLIKAYIPDLFIFLIVFVPYIFIIICLIIRKLTKNTKISDNIFVVMFFPILSFFTKGMSLLEVYVFLDFSEIFFDNFTFFAFLLIGPFIVLINKILIFWHKKNVIEKDGFT
ncbi:MAG: hypothetical protein A2086_10250 [Spirochaetes bacterium GWD1_27_9]|nr:MAG: hypothetical protein A2Y34_09200 [Spirochaetes bacterium GWC1_27_15]OHD43267.1 MAG: hypothetical protein A2086_10250 [Spirochaetes bacterium GWD1_27_9]